MRVYLDNAATTQIDTPVIEAMTKVMFECYGNPSSIHSEGRNSRSLIEEARKNSCQLYQCFYRRSILYFWWNRIKQYGHQMLCSGSWSYQNYHFPY